LERLKLAQFNEQCKFRRLLLRFERLTQLHHAFKTLAYTLINLRHFCWWIKSDGFFP
jgi:hypothetical protein